MNKEETLALYVQGRDAWNMWARAMLLKREALQNDDISVVGDKKKENIESELRKWSQLAFCDFSGNHFTDNEGEFSNYIFPHHAKFSGSIFRGT